MIEYIIALVVGILIGLIGSGGAIVAIPAYFYLANYSFSKATDASLVLVFVSAMIAVFGYARNKYIRYKDTFYFAFSGVIGSYLGTEIHNSLNEKVLLTIFAIILFLASVSMSISDYMKKRQQRFRSDVNSKIVIVLLVGAISGFLTGLLGVGGGFIIIPLLTIVLNYQFKNAVGTSVVVILLNSSSAILFRYLISSFELRIFVTLALVAAVGSVIGLFLNSKLEQKIIQKVFIIFVILVGIFTLIDNIVLELA